MKIMKPTPPSCESPEKYLQPDNEVQLQQQQREVKTSPLEMLTRACDNIGRDFPFTRDQERRSSSPGRNNHLTGDLGSTLHLGKETPGKKHEAPGTVTLGVALMMGLSSEILTDDSAHPSLTTKHHGGVTSQGFPSKKISSSRRRPSSGTWFPPLENLKSRLESNGRSVHLLPQFPRPIPPSSTTFKAAPSHGGETARHRDNSQDWMGYHHHASATSPLRGVRPLRCSLVGWSLPGVLPLGGCLAPGADDLNSNLLTAAYSKDVFSHRSRLGAFLPVSNATSSSSSASAASAVWTDAKASPLSWRKTYCPVGDNKGTQRSPTSCNCILCLLAQDPHLQSLTTEPTVGCDQCQLVDKTLGGTLSSSGILPGRSELMVQPRPTQASPQTRHHWRSLDTKTNPFPLSLESSTLRLFTCQWAQTDATICGKLFQTKEDLLDHLRIHSLLSVEDKTSSPAAGLDSNGSLPMVGFSFPDLFWWNHLQRLSLAAASSKDPLQPLHCFETSTKPHASRYHPYKSALSAMICHGSERAPLRRICPGCLPNDCLHLPLLYSPYCPRLETSMTGS